MNKADLLLVNGRIWCGPGLAEVEALAMAEGRILITGSTVDVLESAGKGARVIDLQGRRATPGLIDAHIHLLAVGLNMADVDLRGTRTLQEVLARLARRVAEAGPGKWIKAVSHDEQQLDVLRHPTRQELDAISPHNPLYIVRSCGHIYLCNSLALASAGIDDQRAAPPGGVIERRNGELTGLIAESTRDLIKAALPRRSVQDLKEGVLRGARHLLSLGITGAMEAGAGRLTGSIDEFTAFRELADEQLLPLRVNLAITAGENGILDQVLAAGYKAGQSLGSGGEWLRIGPAKLHTDGSAGGRTAAMFQPYVGEGCTCGVLMYSDEDFSRRVALRHGQGFQVAVHAIGDRAIEQTLVAFERAEAAQPGTARRHRIEHCGFPTAAQIARMSRLGLVPSPQPIFMHDFGDTYDKVLGPERAAAGYPLRAWLDAGLVPALGTDSPVSQPAPLPNMLAAVTRRTRNGVVLGGDQRVSVEAALAAYTHGGAYAQHDERRLGTLRPGMLADVAVFSEDFLAAPEKSLPRSHCDLTIVGGKVAYERH